MLKLSKDMALLFYEKISAIHYFEYISMAQKVSIFFQDMEHEILSKITGKQEFFDQWNYLKDHQLSIKNQINKNNSIPPTLISDIHSFKPWRNEAVHKASPSIDKVTYLKLFQTMAQTIRFFSEVEWTTEINNIINNQHNEKSKKYNQKKIKKKILGKNIAINIVNKELSLKLNDKNAAYSSINELVTQWSFNINNSKFKKDYYIILEDQDDKIIYYFYLERNLIKDPKILFNQRNDDRVKNKSIIIIPKNDNKIFTNSWQGKEFKFNKYKILEYKYE